MAALSAVVLTLAIAAAADVPTSAALFTSSTSNPENTFQAADSFGPACPSSTPTPAWLTGMEHGSTAGDIITSSNGASADSTVAHNGGYSLKVNKTSTLANARKGGALSPVNGNQQVLHFAMRLAALPSADVTVGWLDSTVGTDLFLKYQASSQKLTLQWGAQAPVVATAAFNANTWYSIDIKASTAASPLTADWEIDGIDQPDTSITATATSHSSIYFGSLAGTSEPATYTAYYDDIFYSKTLADYPVGDVKIQALRPNANGTHLSPTKFRQDGDTAIDANSWQRLDDTTLFGGTDYVKQILAGTGDYLEFGFDNTTETCLRGVQGYATMGSLGSQGNTAKSSIFDGGTERVIYSGNSPCGNCTLPKNAVITPASGSWTQSALNAAVARIGYATLDSPQPYWGQLMLEYAAR